MPLIIADIAKLIPMLISALPTTDSASNPKVAALAPKVSCCNAALCFKADSRAALVAWTKSSPVSLDKSLVFFISSVICF